MQRSFYGFEGYIASEAYDFGDLPTTAPTAAPTASPTLAPTLSPTIAAPTPTPTRNMAPVSGSYRYYTYHAGSECLSSPDFYSIERSVINECLPADANNAAPFKLTCKKSMYNVTDSIWKATYASTDASCTGTRVSSTLLNHQFLCAPSPSTGGYVKSHCGNMPNSIMKRSQLFIKAFPQTSTSGSVTCSTANTQRSTRAYMLKACMAFSSPSPPGTSSITTPIVRFYRKLELKSPYSAGGDVVLTETRYAPTDNRCKNAPFKTKTVTFYSPTVSSSCTRSPLDAKMAYGSVAYYDGNTANWADVADDFIRLNIADPTLAPIAAPTEAPK